jgi:hypothetical protein
MGTSDMDQVQALRRVSPAFAFREALVLSPVLLTLAYPFLLKGFNASITGSDGPGTNVQWMAASIFLLCVMSLPLVGLLWAHRLTTSSGTPSPFLIRARQLAYFTMAAPPLFVFIGVTRGLVGRPLSDDTVWLGGWLLAIGYVFLRRNRDISAVVPKSTPRWRVAHGVSAALILLFVCFHLTNHLSGLLSPEVHASIMKMGRAVYRIPAVEFMLVGLLLFQMSSGLTLAVRWSRTAGDAFRVFQIGSGIYVAAFIITHLNSALISARAVRHIETDWAWASGGVEGLIYDSWNIRLVPHYAFGVFFVLSHLFSGLRQVLIAHDVSVRLANRVWMIGVLVSLVIASAIMAGLFGARI